MGMLPVFVKMGGPDVVYGTLAKSLGDWGPFDREARVLTENVPASVSENSSSFIFVRFCVSRYDFNHNLKRFGVISGPWKISRVGG